MSLHEFQDEGKACFLLRGITQSTASLQIFIDYGETARPNEKIDDILPTFNLDRLHFTPTFILPLDHNYFAENRAYEQLQFEEKVQRNLLPLKVIPIRKSTPQSPCIDLRPPEGDYCLVCKEKYKDYFEHIDSPLHKSRISSNNTNRSIQQLCEKYKFQAQNNSPDKTKGIQKNRQEARVTRSKLHPNCEKKEPISSGNNTSTSQTNRTDDRPIRRKRK